MKITNVKATPVNIPLNYPYLWSLGVFCGGAKLIIEVETDEGLVGLGEASSIGLINQVLSMGQMLVGKNPLDLVDCELTVLPEVKALANLGGGDLITAYGAIEMALWDLKGKIFDMPLYALLGGAYKKDIKFTEYFGFNGNMQADGKTFKPQMQPEEVVEHCLKMKEEHGSMLFEGKIATHDNPYIDLKTVKLLREALGEEAMIRLDVNYGFSMPTMKNFLYEINDLNIRNIEDPAVDYADMVELKKYTNIDFSTHATDLRRAAIYGGPDSFCVHPAVLGGISNTIKFINACEAMGKGVWFYSGDAGVATAAYLHLSAACSHVTEPSQSLFRWQSEDIIEDGPFQIENNVVHVPNTAGLGVTLDRKQMKKLNDDLKINGYLPQYHDFKKPGKYPRLPRV